MDEAQNLISIYSMAFAIRMVINAHALSTLGGNGTNHNRPRTQKLARGEDVDAISGPIFKHFFAALTAQYFEAAGTPLCDACHRRSSLRVAALVHEEDYKKAGMTQILQCSQCDCQGFLITAKNSSTGDEADGREGRSKHSLAEFSFGLALPDSSYKSRQIITRSGTKAEQMIMSMPIRSGVYALCAEYLPGGIGVDTDINLVVIADQNERIKRHHAILKAFLDHFRNIKGAHTASSLPQVSEMEGVIVIRKHVGIPPFVSPLNPDFITKTEQFKGEDCDVYAFDSVIKFTKVMNQLIAQSYPAFPPYYEVC